MKQALVFIAAAFCAAPLFAARHFGLAADAFRSATAKETKTVVFSPASFEIDCAIIAESLATIPKANVSERMGITIDFRSTYQPIIEAYTGEATNSLKVLSARGFCVSDMKTAAAAHRQYLEETYGVEVMRLKPKEGAESWLKATMEGEMEEFEIPANVVHGDRYAFYDLMSFSAAWRDPFPTANTRKVKGVTCLSDVRLADTWEASTFTALRLPLKNDAYFFALLPKEGADLAALKTRLTAEMLESLPVVMESVSEAGVAHGPCAIILPKFSLLSRVNLIPVFANAQVPTKGLVHVAGEVSARECAQYMRFNLAENGLAETPLKEKDAKDVIALTPQVKRLFFTKPFLFFIYHQPTATVPVFGQYVP